jgi:peptidoglycan-associated lipoprotein
MRRLSLVLALAAVGAPEAFGQAIGNNQEMVVPRFELSVGYLHLNANAPPGAGCKCFGLNGAYVSGGYRVKDWLNVVGEATGSHANNISALGQNLTLMTFMGGPKVQAHVGHLVPFGQALFGVGRGSDSYFPTATSFTTSASGFAYSVGGGLDINLTRRFALRAVDAEYLRTSLPNGSTNSQSHLKIAAGIVIKFGGHGYVPPPSPPPSPVMSEIHFTCGAAVATVDAGQTIEVLGHAETRPNQLDLTYHWASNGGRIQGTGRRITVDTTGLAAGEYHVAGQAALVSNPSTTADCEAAFHVNKKAEVQVATTSDTQAPTATAEKAFHENVQDALFDYDSYKIRPDGEVAIQRAAEYLVKHPEIGVTIGGYSDERGSAEYNLALGEKRASAARDALVQAGVEAERLKIISYGKEAQVCTAGNEKCWQQNRRAAFNMHY